MFNTTTYNFKTQLKFRRLRSFGTYPSVHGDVGMNTWDKLSGAAPTTLPTETLIGVSRWLLRSMEDNASPLRIHLLMCILLEPEFYI